MLSVPPLVDLRNRFVYYKLKSSRPHYSNSMLIAIRSGRGRWQQVALAKASIGTPHDQDVQIVADTSVQNEVILARANAVLGAPILWQRNMLYKNHNEIG